MSFWLRQRPAPCAPARPHPMHGPLRSLQGTGKSRHQKSLTEVALRNIAAALLESGFTVRTSSVATATSA